MKPAAFEFIRAASIAEASRILAQSQGAARVVAGAQSLGPMLNLRLARPRILVDITGIRELLHVEQKSDALFIGACITHANIEDGSVPDVTAGAMRSVAAGIAYRAVRNRGTIGGSVCHADPAADWVSLLTALDAECIIAGVDGERRVPTADFVTGAYETALRTGELLKAIRVPRLSRHGRCGYYKICRKAGEFALAIGVVVIDPERDLFRAVLAAANGRPIVIPDMSPLRNKEGHIDDASLVQVLENNGIINRVDSRQKSAAIKRAYRQAAA
ncbi:MAG TPA: FAD binding domain-containing protein [Pseudolabrys sp.]|nr:FAD binding domain-containing protein [Pseudolabrys sp.]